MNPICIYLIENESHLKQIMKLILKNQFARLLRMNPICIKTNYLKKGNNMVKIPDVSSPTVFYNSFTIDVRAYCF